MKWNGHFQLNFEIGLFLYSVNCSSIDSEGEIDVVYMYDDYMYM